MNSSYKNKGLWFLLLPLFATMGVVGDDSELPAYVRESLNSQGQLSLSVEKLADTLSTEVVDSFKPDDLPFHAEDEKPTIEEMDSWIRFAGA